MDYQATLYGPVYGLLGVPALLRLASGAAFAVTALDKTAGVAVGGAVDVQTVVPVAVVRVTELAAKGVTPAQIDDGQITLNGVTWEIEAHKPAPSPNGEADGEVYLLLKGSVG